MNPPVSQPDPGLPGMRIVAYIDILGFRALLARMFGDEPELYSELRNALSRIRQYEHSFQQDSLLPIEASAFSDCIVVSAAAEESVELSLLTRIATLSSSLLESGILIRGGVATGRTHHNGGIVFGEGLVRAYELERSVAKYPRIVVARDLSDSAQHSLPPGLLIQDLDGCWYCNPFYGYWEPAPWKPMSGMAGILDAYARGRFNTDRLLKVRAQLVKMLARERTREPWALDILSKVSWIASRFNEVVKQARPSPEIYEISI
jgi:hypothetical protein